MNICVAGWYFHKPLLELLDNSMYEYRIIAHRNNGNLASDCTLIPNIGLEFGCYDWYLKHDWQSGDALFIHDDIEISEKALMLVANIGRDQAFLFGSEDEARANGYAHGRAIYCSDRFLRRLKDDGGFWFDEGNAGDVSPTTADAPNYHNAGILTFRAYLATLPTEYSVSRYAVIPGMKCGYRGRI